MPLLWAQVDTKEEYKETSTRCLALDQSIKSASAGNGHSNGPGTWMRSLDRGPNSAVTDVSVAGC